MSTNVIHVLDDSGDIDYYETVLLESGEYRFEHQISVQMVNDIYNKLQQNKSISIDVMEVSIAECPCDIRMKMTDNNITTKIVIRDLYIPHKVLNRLVYTICEIGSYTKDRSHRIPDVNIIASLLDSILHEVYALNAEAVICNTGNIEEDIILFKGEYNEMIENSKTAGTVETCWLCYDDCLETEVSDCCKHTIHIKCALQLIQHRKQTEDTGFQCGCCRKVVNIFSV